MGIEFKDDAVCFASGLQWLACDNADLKSEHGMLANYEMVISSKDFQLNTIKQGDYIEVSELDAENKYNDAVEVFTLFGFSFSAMAIDKYENLVNNYSLVCCDDGLWQTSSDRWNERKLTFNQLMAIGALTRLEIERDKEPQFGKNEDGSMRLIKSNFSASSNKYEREITDRQGNSAVVDAYDVLKAFDVTCPATQHALKKLLCSGLRGHKDLQTDLLEAKESITRAIELNE